MQVYFGSLDLSPYCIGHFNNHFNFRAFDPDTSQTFLNLIFAREIHSHAFYYKGVSSYQVTQVFALKIFLLGSPSNLRHECDQLIFSDLRAHLFYFNQRGEGAKPWDIFPLKRAYVD